MTGDDSLQFILKKDNDDSVIIPFSRHGGKQSIAFGAEGNRCGLWKVIVNRKGDIYLVERTLGRSLKLSLHQSGDWRWQFEQESIQRSAVARAAVDANGNRVMAQWARASCESGVLRAFRIFTTGADMAQVPNDPEGKDTIWLPKLGMNELGLIEIILMRPDAAQIELKGLVPAFVAGTFSEYCVLLTFGKRAIEDKELEIINGLRTQCQTSLNKTMSKTMEKNGALRALVYGSFGADGTAEAYDLALQSELTNHDISEDSNNHALGCHPQAP